MNPYTIGLASCSSGQPGDDGTQAKAYTSSLMTNSTTYGDNYKDWKRRLARGDNACTTLVFNGYGISRNEPVGMVWNPTCNANCTGIPRGDLDHIATSFYGYVPLIQFPSTPSSISVSSVDNLARTKVWQKIDQVNTPAYWGENFGELRELLHMLHTPGKTLLNGLVGWVKHAKKRLPRIPRHKRQAFLSETYLEYKFGWKPLHDDVVSAAQALAERSLRLEGKPNGKLVKGWAQETTVTATYRNLPVYVNGWVRLYADRVESSEATVRYQVMVNLEDAAGFPGIARILGLDLEHFVPTVWELIPFSFVVDYFTNIGDIIYAVSRGTGSIRWVNRTDVQRKVLDYRNVRPDPVNYPAWEKNCQGYVSSSSVGRVTTYNVIINRVANSYLPYPDFQWQIPGMKSTRWLNLAALYRVLRH